MNKFLKVSTLAVAVATIAGSVFAQDQKVKPFNNKEEKSEEIIIKKKGDKTEKMTIVVDGDKITINGKPADEFKNGDITVLRRDRSLATAPNIRRFGNGRSFNPEDLNRLSEEAHSKLLEARSNRAMLGILTQKAANGVKVTDVTKESGAEKAGLKKDDIITKAGNTKIETPESLVEVISGYKPNDKVEITYLRNGAENKTTAVLGENKSKVYSFNLNKDFNFDMPDGFNFDFNKPKMGLQIQDVDEGKGVKVKDVNDESPAAKAGIKQGDVITQLNGKDVDGVDSLRNEIRDLKEGDVVKFNYRRDGKNQTAEVKIPKKLKSADL